MRCNLRFWCHLFFKKLERQVRSESVKLSVNEFCDFFCWAKNPHTQAGLTIDTCKSIDGSLFLNCIQIKTNSGNAHYHYQHTNVFLIFKMSQKSQISKCERTTKIHSINTDVIDGLRQGGCDGGKKEGKTCENDFIETIFYDFCTWSDIETGQNDLKLLKTKICSWHTLA